MNLKYNLSNIQLNSPLLIKSSCHLQLLALSPKKVPTHICREKTMLSPLYCIQTLKLNMANQRVMKDQTKIKTLRKISRKAEARLTIWREKANTN